MAKETYKTADIPEPLGGLTAELEHFHEQRWPVIFERNALHLVEEHLCVCVRERERKRERVCVYIYIHTHTHTHIFISTHANLCAILKIDLYSAYSQKSHF